MSFTNKDEKKPKTTVPQNDNNAGYVERVSERLYTYAEFQAQVKAEVAKQLLEHLPRLEACVRNTVSEHNENSVRRHSEARGLGSYNAKPTPTREDLAPFAAAKIEMTGLADIVSEIATATGLTVDQIVGGRQ